MNERINLPTDVDAPLLLHGDSFDVLDGLPAASVDVCITDPPADIGFMATSERNWDRFTGYQPRTTRGTEVHGRLTGLFGRNEVGFVVAMVDIWTKVARVLKPGAFVVAWALPKTADLQALAMRCVGWEVHDSCLHLFGMGMTKGKDISKAIDKMHGAERVRSGTRSVDADRWTEAGRRALERGEIRYEIPITAPATEDARRWDGWNTQLAPGWEQYLIADTGRAGTYAEQVLTHGTGALHVDVCRIPRSEADREVMDNRSGAGMGTNQCDAGRGVGEKFKSNPSGSWPRNVILTHAAECEPGACADGCPAGELDRQSGEQRDGISVKRNLPDEGGKPGITAIKPGSQRQPDQTYAGRGGASRFFTNLGYFPKAHDRRAGFRQDIINRHNTHKNPDLTEWLTRLFAATSEQTAGLPAVVLDPFSGSFTGAVAAIRARVRFVGITLDAADVEVGRARVAAAVGSRRSPPRPTGLHPRTAN